MFTDFILNVPMGLLTIQKLYCLIEIIHSDLFTQHGEWNPENLQMLPLVIVCRPCPSESSLPLSGEWGGCSN